MIRRLAIRTNILLGKPSGKYENPDCQHDNSNKKKSYQIAKYSCDHGIWYPTIDI